jgi:hypothetical protein
MDIILGGIRFKTKPETEKNGKITVEMIKHKQVVDTFKIHANLNFKEQIDMISMIVIASYPSLRNTTGFVNKS